MRRWRILSVFLILALMVGLLPAVAAEDTYVVDVGISAQSGAADAEYNGYIVKFRDDVIVPYSAVSDAQALGFNMYLVEDEEKARALEDSAGVAYIEPDYRVELYGSVTDSYYVNGSQWYLNGEHGMNIERAWSWSDGVMENGVTGSGVTVAVLDTGLYSGHYDFTGTNILTGYNATGDGGTYADVDCHGTMVAGIIAAGLNHYGIVGAAYGVDLLPIRVFDSDGYGRVSYIIKALDYAITQDVDVINMSLGLEADVSSFGDAVQAALDAGIIVVAAAGNDGTSVLNYPASYAGVVGVGALDSDGAVASYSQRNSSVWVTAPGSDITSVYSLAGYYATGSGTSFASPCVAALAALAKQYANAHGQALAAEEFASLLKLTATDAGAAGYDYDYGCGTVDAGNMLAGMVERSVVYELNGGAWAGEAPDTAYVPYSGKAVELTAAVPSREDHFFGGWYENADLSGEKVTSFVPADSGETRTYYAKWIENVTELASVTLTAEGEIYAAQEQADGSWIVYLPAGMDIPTGAACVGVSYAYTGSESVLGHEIVDNGDGTWTIQITQDTSNEEYEASYLLAADNTTFHAPAISDNAYAAREGAAAPASLDGKTAAVSYTVSAADWFSDADGDDLAYVMDSFAEDAVETDAIVGLELSGTVITYTPPAAAAGKTVSFAVKASDGRFWSEPVEVTVGVETLPVSAPVLSETSGSYDALEPGDLKVGFTAYDNTLSSVAVADEALTKDADYTVYTGLEIVETAETSENESENEISYVTLKTDYLSTLPNGEYSVAFTFDTGRESEREMTAEYALTVCNSCAAGHAWGEGAVTLDPTCTGPGVLTYTCTVCGETRTEALAAAGHAWDEGAVTLDPTCTGPGVLTYTCTVCGETRTEALAATGHAWDEGAVTLDPTCTESGVLTYTCTVCGETRTETIAAAGHDYVDGICSVCGASSSEALPDNSSSSGGSSSGSSSSGGSSSGGSSGGSLSGTTSYTLTASAGAGGSIDPSGKISVLKSGDQTFTVTPNEGYEISDVLVDGASVGAVSEYTFEKVAEDHTITAVFRQAESAEAASLFAAQNIFADVGPDDWFYDSIQYVYENGLMIGTSADRFSPTADTTRGMVVTILWRLAGEPKAQGAADFPDVRTGAYYAEAVAWADSAGIVHGYDDNAFHPDDSITREQLAAMLFRYAGLEGRDTALETDLTDFVDWEQISLYATRAMQWANAAGLMTGTDWNGLAPQAPTTRAEVAAVLQRYILAAE